MTVQTTDSALPVVTGGSLPGLDLLSDWLTAAGHAEALAKQLVRSFFVPAAYKPGNPNDPAAIELAVANATGAILLGQSLGLDPLTSLQQIYVVHGRPGMYAKMKVALAQAAGHRITEIEYGPERSTWEGQRAGSSDVVRLTLTIEDAQRADWTTNAAYRKTPADMLAARCSSRVVDRIAADVLFGIRSIEDLDDAPEPPTAVHVTAADITGKPAAIAPAPSGLLAQAAQREAEPAPASPERPEPEAPQATEAEVVPPAPMDGITEQQKRKLGEVFAVLDVTGTGQRIRRAAIGGHILGKPCGSILDLSDAEADQVLAKLTEVAKLQPTERALVVAAMEGRAPAAPQPEPEQPAEAPAPVEAKRDLEPPADDPWANAGAE